MFDFLIHLIIVIYEWRDKQFMTGGTLLLSRRESQLDVM